MNISKVVFKQHEENRAVVRSGDKVYIKTPNRLYCELFPSRGGEDPSASLENLESSNSVLELSSASGGGGQKGKG